MKYPDIFNPDISRVGTAHSQKYNISAAIMLAQTVGTSLGPRGMEKMYVDIIGEETLTKHGGAFLRKLDVDHPAAKAVVDGINTVDNHVGDGTILTAVFAGALLLQAQTLIRLRVPTATIIGGFELGAQLALENLDKIRIAVDEQTRHAVIRSCISSKALYEAVPDTIRIINEAVECVSDAGRVNVDMIKIEEKLGRAQDTELVRGTVLDKPVDSALMPTRLKNATVLLLNDPLEIMRTKTESAINIREPGQMAAFLKQEEQDVAGTVRCVIDSGATLVVSRKGIGELAQGYLAERGIMSVRRAKYNDLWWLEHATGASTCSDIYDISSAELGRADSVTQRMVGGDPMLFVESRRPGSVTILLRAHSKRYLDELHRNVLNAVMVLAGFVEDPYVVYGGGACEAALAGGIRRAAPYVEGREQVVLERFADALEEVPATLASNLGLSALDVIPELRARCAADPHGWWGIDSACRKVAQIRDVLDTYAVKRQVIKSAVATACLILNIDDIFMKDVIDNTHCHLDGTVHAHKEPGRNHNHWEQEGLEQRQMHHYY